MLKDYMGILTLNENETDIRALTNSRTLAAVPIAGRYRVVDFILSNMVNAGMRNIGIFTQSNSRALIDHLGNGKPWDLNRNVEGLFVFNFNIGNAQNYDVKMLRNNMEYFYRSKQTYVILAPSYMLCNIDFEEAAKAHEESGSDITIIYKKLANSNGNMLNCDILNMDDKGRVLSVGKNIGVDKDVNISMEMFIMKKDTLINLVYKGIQTGYYDNIKDSIYKNVMEFDVNSYEFKGYMKCINSITQYYQFNMDLLNPKITEELFFKNGNIYTKVKNEPPSKYARSSNVSNSLVANGCIIEGTVENSIISRHVRIQKDVVIKNSIILQNCEIRKGANLTNVIVDKNVVIEKDTVLTGNVNFPVVIEKKSIINSYEPFAIY